MINDVQLMCHDELSHDLNKVIADNHNIKHRRYLCS
jgi:hypothetical protein